MNRAAIGFRVHSGWAAMVAVSVEKGEPVILVRRKLLLVKTFSYTFRQPYHTAEKMPLNDAAAFHTERGKRIVRTGAGWNSCGAERVKFTRLQSCRKRFVAGFGARIARI